MHASHYVAPCARWILIVAGFQHRSGKEEGIMQVRCLHTTPLCQCHYCLPGDQCAQEVKDVGDDGNNQSMLMIGEAERTCTNPYVQPFCFLVSGLAH